MVTLSFLWKPLLGLALVALVFALGMQHGIKVTKMEYALQQQKTLISQEEVVRGINGSQNDFIISDDDGLIERMRINGWYKADIEQQPDLLNCENCGCARTGVNAPASGYRP